MILAILFILMFAGGMGIVFALLVLAIGYRDMTQRATQSANMNAGYWAEAQERTALVEAYNERLSEHLTENQKLLTKMTDHAREALRLAHTKQSVPFWREPPLPVIEDDSILNAREIDG